MNEDKGQMRDDDEVSKFTDDGDQEEIATTASSLSWVDAHKAVATLEGGGRNLSTDSGPLELEDDVEGEWNPTKWQNFKATTSINVKLNIVSRTC